LQAVTEDVFIYAAQRIRGFYLNALYKSTFDILSVCQVKVHCAIVGVLVLIGIEVELWMEDKSMEDKFVTGVSSSKLGLSGQGHYYT